MKASCSLSRRIGFTFPLILGAWISGLHAQPGSLDTGFNAASTTGQVGFSVAVQSDGKVIAVGTFGVMRFLTDGTVDPAFQSIPPGLSPFTGPGSGNGKVVLQADGRILLTGIFTNAAGMPLPNLVRLNADGSVDSSFNLDAAVATGGRALLLQPDGKVLTSGFVTRPGGESTGGLMRLHSDGSLDPSFDSSGAMTGDPSVVALASDGKIYFVDSTGVGRLNSDGSRDLSFNPEPDPYPLPAVIVVQRDGKVILGGYSDGPAPPFRPVRRLLPDGTDDPDWIVPAFNGGDAVVYALLLQPDGKVLVGGNNLESFNSVLNANLGRLNSDGSVDTTFDTGYDLHYYSVEDMALAPDGKVIAAGMQVNRPDITQAPGVWRLNNDTGLQPQLAISFTMNEGVTLRLSGQSGATYRLEYREQLPDVGAWTPLTELTLSGSSATWQDTSSQNSRTRFYRAVALQ
ncbi:MAG TPA: hypothetical protein VFT34_00610 [Verrucomicrobiae bacterium]|nr:hypothetical protein [Verrucomicrobiae bacterium]